jgi:uncharacterized Fe-S cluster-containing protein
MTTTLDKIALSDLPGLNCGVCGFRTCKELADRLEQKPELLQRCIHLSRNKVKAAVTADRSLTCSESCGKTCGVTSQTFAAPPPSPDGVWRDTLGREFDFFLEHFPEDPGPREIVLPHNPMLTREMNIQPGDIMIGRPLGMSCGCPITHCGVVMQVDARTGVIVWCVTGPLKPRQEGFKDIGYYIAEGYEGMIYDTRAEIKIGARYFFQPRMCMLQWRHSGLVNYVNKTPKGLQVRLEGLWIG